MMIKVVKTGETMEVNDSYGARMIEQGAAVICQSETSEQGEQPKKGKKNGAG